MLMSARKSCLGLKEYTVQHRSLQPSQQANIEKQISATCSKTPPVRDRMRMTEYRCQGDTAGSIEIFPIWFPISPPVPLSSITSHGWPWSFTYNWNSGLSGRESQMNACLYSRHNKAQNTAQRLLYSRRREGIWKANTKEAPTLRWAL